MEDVSRIREAVGERVTLTANTLEITAELTECKPMGSGETPALSLLFETDQAEAVPQQIFQVSGQLIGEISLFLVPIGPGRKGMVYEAVIDSRQAATP